MDENQLLDAPVAPQPWLAVRFELELKGLPHGWQGVSRSGYSLGHAGPVSLTEVLVGLTKTTTDFWLQYLESDPEEALAAMGGVADELQRLVDVFSDVKIVSQTPETPEEESDAP